MLLVDLYFPDGFKLVKREDVKGQWPKPPKGPKKPGIDDFLVRAVLQDPHLSRIYSQSPPVQQSMTIIKTNSYKVAWEHEKLRQNTSEPLDEMAAMFDTEVHSFGIKYELRADNLKDVITGELHVAVT